MAKRFTDTDKWKKPFIRGLQGAYKVLWLYILDDCDHAGIWQVDLDVAGLRVGESLDEATAIEQFKNHIQVFDNGEKWFIPAFIEFQYGSELNPDNRVHESVLKLLSKYKLSINKEHISPLQGAKDKDKDKDKDLDKDKDQEKENAKIENSEDGKIEDEKKVEPKSLIPENFPFKSPEAKKAMEDYIIHRRQLGVKKYTAKGIELAMKEWESWGEAMFIESVYRSIKRNYQGIFPPNSNQNDSYQKSNQQGRRVEPSNNPDGFGQF